MKELTVELLTTGTELLLGSVVNTNASWIGERLFEAGLRLERQTTVPDGDEVYDAMKEAAGRSDVVLVTGGLGPTSDDLTREALARLCQVELRMDETVLARLKAFFERRGRPMAASNERQALVPEGARALDNDHGTAPGLWMPGLPGNRGEVVLLPGPPHEMMPMMASQVLPVLAGRVDHARTRLRVIKMIGIGESDLQDSVDFGLSQIAGLEYGYCARPGEVDVRLIGGEPVLEKASMLLDSRLPDYVLKPYGTALEEVLVTQLRERGMKAATAESCTGGLIAQRITDVPGSSDVYEYGYVTYSNDAKRHLLGVEEDLLATHGAVSEPVARAMAEGAMEDSGADCAISVTGIAGPSGGSDDKPVGTVWMAWALKGRETVAYRGFYPTGRSAFRRIVSEQVLFRLLKLIGG